MQSSDHDNGDEEKLEISWIFRRCSQRIQWLILQWGGGYWEINRQAMQDEVPLGGSEKLDNKAEINVWFEVALVNLDEDA